MTSESLCQAIALHLHCKNIGDDRSQVRAIES